VLVQVPELQVSSLPLATVPAGAAKLAGGVGGRIAGGVPGISGALDD